jgi:hypothetical protein
MLVRSVMINVTFKIIKEKDFMSLISIGSSKRPYPMSKIVYTTSLSNGIQRCLRWWGDCKRLPVGIHIYIENGKTIFSMKQKVHDTWVNLLLKQI